jgi:LPS-assembly protein
MRKFSAITTLAAITFLLATFPLATWAQEQPAWEVWALNQIIPGSPVGEIQFGLSDNTAFGTNGICIRYGTAVLTADTATVNRDTGEAVADGHVRIEQGEQLWVGDHIRYNFKTHQMVSEQFRTGKSPMFASGKQLQGDTTNQTYNARHALATSDDVHDPANYIRASRIKIIPGKYIEMWHAVMFVERVPVFYFPYYRRDLSPHAGHWTFTAGDRTSYGPFILNTYTWWLNDMVDGKLHLDYREKRGPGLGPDVNLHLGQWGNADFQYYYTHDRDQYAGTNGLPDFGPISENRQRVYLAWQATPATNLNLKALVNYQSDAYLEHDFFENDYLQNPQPNTFFEQNKYWDNWNLDALTTPQLNNFFDQVERLPDVRLTGYSQQVLNTPVYYDSQSSIGYYKKYFADTNGPTPPAYSAGRMDTFHQLLVPWVFFNWLNITPNVGGRLTYYTDETGPGGTNSEAWRAVLNTGVGASFKASQLWPSVRSSFWDVDGLRHVIEPSANYVFVPNPSKAPSQLPQFDSALPSLMLLPVQFPDYNNIDSIDSEHVIRFGLHNTLQTKRDGQIDELLDWNLTLDWRLNPGSVRNNLDEPDSPQQTFSDLYSEFKFKPRQWVTFESQSRFDLNNSDLNLAFDQITFMPNERWSWAAGYWYFRQGVDGFTTGNNYITTTAFYRLNDNWGLRATENFNVEDGRLQQQYYTLYRDMRSWTAALTFRVLDNTTGPTDYTVAFTFSLKASPSHRLGDDTVDPYHLLSN